MLIEGFDNKFELDDYNKANNNLKVDYYSDLYEIFTGFLKNEELMNKALEEVEKGNSPVSLFIDSNFDFLDNKLRSFNNNQAEIRKFKKTISELWNFMFLRTNKTIYKGKTMKPNPNNKILQHVPVYGKNNVKKLHVFVEGVYFATRSVACIKEYSKAIDDIEKYSDPLLDEDNNPYEPLISYFTNHFFKTDEVSVGKKIFRFNGFNKDHCKKGNGTIFLLKTVNALKDDPFTSVFKEENIIKDLKSNIAKYIDRFENIMINNQKLLKDLDIDYSKMKENINNSTYNRIINYGYRIISDFKKARFSITNYYAKTSIKDSNLEDFDKLGEIISFINDLCDVYNIISRKDRHFRILLFLNKLGTINIVLLDSSCFVSKWENEGYSDVYDNRLVDEAFNASLKIEKKSHELSKLFNLIDLNKLITPEDDNNCVLGLPYTIKKDKNNNKVNDLFKQIYENNNLSKAIYLRLTYNHKDIIDGDESAMIYFDFLSLLVGHSHSYDKYTLWEYANHNQPITNEYKSKIEDMASSRTSHLFYDDSLFVYSIMDQSPRFEKFNHLTNREGDYKNLQSHKHRLYSLWEFSSICDALIYGSSSGFIHSLLIRQVEKESNKQSKASILSSQHRLSRVYSIINLKMNHLVYNPKGRNFELIDNVFKKIGLIDVEERAKSTFDANWQYANLNNGRLYQRIGLYFSIASFAISIIAFAWAGATFIDYSTQRKKGYGWNNLFLDLFKAHKFHFILIVALIPILVFAFLSIRDYCKNMKISKNIVKYFLKEDIKLIK